jgi:hypothetical protein
MYVRERERERENLWVEPHLRRLRSVQQAEAYNQTITQLQVSF